MKYIATLREGMHISDVYLCKNKSILISKAGKEYASLTLQDKTGTVDAKIWDLGSPGIGDFEALDYVAIEADVITFNNNNQLNIKRVRIAHEREYLQEDYLPVTKYDIEEMYAKLLKHISNVKNSYLNKLLSAFFIEDQEFIKRYKFSSAAKSVHHGFVGGLLEHTLSLSNLCRYISRAYPIINHDLLITAAIFHDIGKTQELSPFPANDYTDAGQLLGHIVIGVNMICEKARTIVGFPEELLIQLNHCILSHHGELEYGSPKKPALVEAMALSLADNLDAKIQTMTELLGNADANVQWIGYNRMLETNIRRTQVQDEKDENRWSNTVL